MVLLTFETVETVDMVLNIVLLAFSQLKVKHIANLIVFHAKSYVCIGFPLQAAHVDNEQNIDR